MDIRQRIEDKLSEIEHRENIKILLAVESGSRAWGFASPDSDFDVRFLYVRPREYYLRLDKTRDVIEIIEGELDIGGWDMDKTLRLLHGSNPTLFEWLRSPVVYRRNPFIERLTELSDEYFLLKPGLYHYMSMAEGNYREFLKGNTVILKKYFYVLRPLLACRHILAEGTPPPMEFSKLLFARMDKSILPVVERLLEKKKASKEVGTGPRINVLNDYIEKSIPELKENIGSLPSSPKKDFKRLNGLFLECLEI